MRNWFMKSNNSQHPAQDGTVGWTCPSNIALVKYWGKRPGQIPMNPSLSMTLRNAFTTTRIKYSYNPSLSPSELIFSFEGKEHPSFQKRIEKYLEGLLSFMPFLAHTSLEIASENSFPHSSGIASSASAMGAIALCLVSMEENITRSHNDDPLKKASFLARLGSGSASRSLYPQFVLWGAYVEWPGSADEFAIPLKETNQSFLEMRDSILIVESTQKQVSSSAGHQLMETNPYAGTRFKQAKFNLGRLKKILSSGDWKDFIELVEEEALSLHAMMMTGKPGYLLMRPGTLEIIRKVQEFRREKTKHLAFTLDAGANVHLLYKKAQEKSIRAFIDSELLSHCENKLVIHDQMGSGPILLK
jgi:diphosphomevalonate decarboxylase